MPKTEQIPVAQRVAGGISPSVFLFQKIVLRLIDMATASPGTVINFLPSGEIRLMSDFPIFLQYGFSGSFIEGMEFELGGDVKSVRIYRGSSSTPGRIVIYTSGEGFDIGWTRDSWRDRPAFAQDQGGTWSASTGSFTGAALTLPESGRALEARYLWGISFDRSAGTVSRIQYVESETGSNLSLYDEYIEVPVGTGIVRLEKPIKLSAAGSFVFTGSSVAGASTLIANAYMIGI